MRGRRDDKENDSRTSRRVEINDDGRQRRSYREHFGDEVYAGTVGRTQFTAYRGDERSRMGTKRKEEDEMSRKVDSPRMETQGRPPLGATENKVISRRTEERQYEDNRDKYERMREMRQRDNEERIRRMKEETRETGIGNLTQEKCEKEPDHPAEREKEWIDEWNLSRKKLGPGLP